MNGLPPSARELDLAQHAYTLSLGGMAEGMARALGEIDDERSRLRWYDWRERRRLLAEEEFVSRMYRVYTTYAREQDISPSGQG